MQMTSADGGEFIIEVKKEDEQKEEGRSPPKKHCKLPRYIVVYFLYLEIFGYNYIGHNHFIDILRKNNFNF